MNRSQKIAEIKTIAAQPQVIKILTTDCQTNSRTGEPITPDEIEGIESGRIILEWDYSKLSDETLRKLLAGENPFNE